MPTYLGIDPGASGGLVAITYFSHGDSIDSVPMPVTERDIWLWFCRDTTYAVIEKVGGFIPRKGAEHGQPGAYMFNFGASYGGLRMALIASGTPFEEVPPQRWQKALHISPKGKGESRTEWKSRLKALAQQLYPNEKITLKTADAFLLATYCKRLREGTL